MKVEREIEDKLADLEERNDDYRHNQSMIDALKWVLDYGEGDV